MHRIPSMMCLSLLALGLSVAGCDRRTGGAGGDPLGRVAVIDLDKVSVAMGWAQEANESLAAFTQDLDRKVREVAVSLQKAVDDEKQKMGPNPTTQQSEALARMAQVANQRFAGVQAQAREELSRTRMGLILQYRDQIRPVARRVAEEQGMSVVIVPMDYILYYNPRNDVTDRVIDELQKNRPTVKPNVPTIVVPPGATQPAPPNAPK